MPLTTTGLFSGDNSEEYLASSARGSLRHCMENLALYASFILLLIRATLGRRKGVIHAVSALQQFFYLLTCGYLRVEFVLLSFSERYTSEGQTGVTEIANRIDL
jgi:hypothetical protein